MKERKCEGNINCLEGEKDKREITGDKKEEKK